LIKAAMLSMKKRTAGSATKRKKMSKTRFQRGVFVVASMLNTQRAGGRASSTQLHKPPVTRKMNAFPTQEVVRPDENIL
jgi:hypothetical protein